MARECSTGFMDPSHSSALSSVSQNSHVVSLNALTEEIVAYEKEIDDTHAVKIKGNVYDSVDDCVVAYMKYAAEAGMGFPKGIHADTLDLGNSDKQKRNSNLHITGCKARAVFNLDTCTRKFVLKVFDTIHNHELEREEYKHLSKTERQLTYMEQAFIVKAASVNIGATRAHHLLTGIKGSYLLVHGTTVDFKNFFRSVNCYIGDSDAQMLIHKMENRKKHVSDFSFDYLVDNAELTAIFWADEVSKYNYREFGDVVSFDATFKTNKYKMVFVPFTAIDNHRKCVTVAAGLLKNETTKSYIWLLKAFMKAFGKAPSIVVTDQDGAMRNAIEAEFGGSKHRLCMWHITQKLPAKICEKIYDETDFKEKLNKIWLTKMFNIRSTWIPAYFIDSPLCGLMRTTSRSESENSFFSHFTNSGSTLMNFMNCFETAIEKQRHVQERMDHKTIDTVPKLKTLLKIERHASNVYTRSLFELVQKEIFVGLFYCQIDSKCLVEGSEVCIIKESPYVYEMPNKKKKKPQSVDKGNDKADENDKVDMFFKKDGLYKVLRSVGDGSVVCSCQLFVRVGILCKHIFCVFKNANVEMIPQQYILRRWTKNLIPAGLRNKRNRYGEKNVVVENYANEATSIVDHCVHLTKCWT
ncbi:FAR1-related sequence 5-like protein [Tanacetum coccineum]